MAEESSTTSSQEQSNYRLPHGTTMQHASKLAIVEDKPIMFDYWTGSLDKEVLIGVRESGEKLLVKSEDFLTSVQLRHCWVLVGWSQEVLKWSWNGFAVLVRWP